MDDQIREITEEVLKKYSLYEKLEQEYGKIIVGQKYLFRKMFSALTAGGHLLVEGVPGLAKSLSVDTLSKILGLNSKRIQFTPDLLPADIRGTLIYNQKTGEFDVKQGPIFSNFILADEINRAPSKVQSALLEAMQEKTVTIGDQTYFLPKPFLVMATQNPIEQEGTYPLPEAQMDRFYMKAVISYPEFSEEKRIMHRMSGMLAPEPKTVTGAEEILSLRNTVQSVYIDERIFDYIAGIVVRTRELPHYVKYGASPRASINFVKAVKTEAFFDQRGYVIPEDVKSVAFDILRHRIVLNFEAEAEGMTAENVIEDVLEKVEIP